MIVYRIVSVVLPVLVLLTCPLQAQDAPKTVSLSTGSELATWSIPSPNPAHKTPVIFLHGGPGMYTTQGAFVKGEPLRAAGFNTIYFDQAGGGKSKRISAKDYTMERAVADLEALRVALGHDKVILWGSSYGASLGTIYASRYPTRVAGIILTSPGSYPGTHASHDYKPTNRDKVKLGKALSSAAGKVDREGAAAESSLSQTEAGNLFDELVNSDLMGGMVCKGAMIKPPPPGTGGNLYANRLIAKDLDKIKFKPEGTIKIPALIIRGACDFISAKSANSFAVLFNTKVTAIPETGHGLYENRDAINAAFSDFAKGALSKVE